MRRRWLFLAIVLLAGLYCLALPVLRTPGDCGKLLRAKPAAKTDATAAGAAAGAAATAATAAVAAVAALALAAEPRHNAECVDDDRDKDPAWCLTQALWSKCSFDFMERCHLSCDRCSPQLSSPRQSALRRTLLVSARQAAPCAMPTADVWVMRAMQNKADYARMHGMAFTWVSALVDPRYDGAWNKLSVLQRLLAERLSAAPKNGSSSSSSSSSSSLGGPPQQQQQQQHDWILWADWDVVFTDLAHTLPLDEYERRGARLVVGGDPAGIGDAAAGQRADYLKVNSGVMAIRVHPWSLALLSRLLAAGGRGRRARARRALEIQEHVANLCVGCIDDQAVLLELLHRGDDGPRWRAHTVLERRYLLQGYWEEYVDQLPAQPQDPRQENAASPLVAGAESATGTGRPPAPLPLRQAHALPLASLRRRVHGSLRVPLSIHFAGCQLCSGKAAAERTVRCWPAFRRTLRFAEDQALQPLRLRHGRLNRSAEFDMALESVDSPVNDHNVDHTRS